MGTPNFIEDVDTYASRLVDSTSVPALPVDPTELFYDKSTPFHDTVNPKTTFDVVGLGAWYSQEDHELISMVQLQPAATSDNQPEPDGAPFWTTLTRYVSDPSPLLPSRFKTVHSTIALWRHHGSLGGSCPFFSTDTVTSRSGGGGPSSLQSTRP